MYLTQFCMLVVVLFDYHHHFHSSLEVLASSAEQRWDKRAWVQLPVKLVSFRHSKFYLSNTKSSASQFTSYEARFNTEENETRTREISSVKSNAIVNLETTDPHHRQEDVKFHRFSSDIQTKNAGKYLINSNVVNSPKMDFPQLKPLVSVSLDTGQEAFNNRNGIQHWKNKLEEETNDFHTRKLSTISSFPTNTNFQSQNYSTESSIEDFNLSNIIDSIKNESRFSPSNSSLNAAKIGKNMPPLESSNSPRLTLPTIPNWIDATEVKAKNQELYKSMNFHEPHFSSQEHIFMAGRYTLPRPELIFWKKQAKSGLVSSSPTIRTNTLNKFTTPMHPDPMMVLIREPEKTKQKKRRSSNKSSKPDEIINDQYPPTKNSFMNNSTRGLPEDGNVLSTSSDSVSSTANPDALNYSFLFPQTINPVTSGEDFLFTISTSNSKTTNTLEEIKESSKDFGNSLPTTLTKGNENDETRAELVKNFKSKYPVKVWAAVGFYDDTYLETVNSHWLQFEPADPLVHKMLGILYGIIMVIGCGGNLLVIVMFVRCRALRTPPNYLIVNLAVSDFFMMSKMPVFIYNSLYEGPALGIVACSAYGFIGGLSGTASIMTLCAIAVDRFYVIVYPMNPLKRTTATRAIMMMTAVWVYSLFFSSMPLFGLNGYVSEGYLTSCSFDYLSEEITDRLFVFIFFIAAFVLPLSIIIFSYSRIFYMVRAAERVEFFCPGTRESFKYKHDQKKHKTEYKIAVLSFGIILIWLLAWTPYAIVALLGIFGYKELITPFISAVPALFCKTASCIDPFLYAINHPRFQRELKNKFKICYGHKKRRSSIDNSYYNSNTYKEPYENNSLTDLKRKHSPPTRGSPDSSIIKTPRRSTGNHASCITVSLKDTDNISTPRLGKSSRNLLSVEKSVTYNLQQNNTPGRTEVNRSNNKKVEICIVGKTRLAHISSLSKKHNDPEKEACCDETNSIPKIDNFETDLSNDIIDTRDLRMKEGLLKNKKSTNLSSPSGSSSSNYSSSSSGGESVNNFIVSVEPKVFNGKSLNADSTTTTSRSNYKLETTIM